MHFFILGKKASEAVFTYAGLQVDTGALHMLQGKNAPGVSQ